MAEAALFLDAGFILVVGVLYVVVAGRLGSRRTSTPSGARALAMFRAWWLGVSGLFLLTGASGVLRGRGVEDEALHFVLVVVSMLSVCVALWGILYYVTYLFSGRTGAFYPYMAYYLGVFFMLVYGVARDPGQVEAWRLSVSRLVILTGPVVTGAIVAFLIPVIVACLFYFSLYFRVDDPVQKYRVGLTSVSFIAWFGSAILAPLLGVADEAWWTLAGRVIGVLASLLVLLAYFPPRGLRERSRLDDKGAPGVPP